ncbi:MAG: carboxymuconolactone decarboxylase family protein [Methanobacteriaceae archaeon]|nr:carboxymuconolactone decarboxylase family protein [Methanobacteriaceae archaeon]
MKISQKAKENHNELLPNHESKLKETDPEFIEIYDNFAFDEVLEHSTLPKRSRMLVTLATLITNQSINEYKIMIKGAMNLGLTPIEIKETLYQSLPYVGLAKAFDFLNATNEVFTKEGITLPLKGQSTTNRENRKAKGKEKQAQYFGEEVVKAMAENAIPGQEHFNEFLEGYCFGDFYTRTGLNDADRELITFSIIASLGGCENQLRGHTAGNLSVGNDKETLVSAVTILMPYIGFPRTLNALAIINEICE